MGSGGWGSCWLNQDWRGPNPIGTKSGSRSTLCKCSNGTPSRLPFAPTTPSTLKPWSVAVPSPREPLRGGKKVETRGQGRGSLCPHCSPQGTDETHHSPGLSWNLPRQPWFPKQQEQQTNPPLGKGIRVL